MIKVTDEELKICERFKEIRLSLKMKQGDFAKEVKTTQGHVSDIENGRKGVSDRVIEIICLKYGINEEWLRYGTGDMILDTNISYGEICSKIAIHDERAKKLIMDYYSLSREDKELFWKFIERFIRK